MNGDGRAAVVLHFSTAAIALEVGALEATIAGTITDGRGFRGTRISRGT